MLRLHRVSGCSGPQRVYGPNPKGYTVRTEKGIPSELKRVYGLRLKGYTLSGPEGIPFGARRVYGLRSGLGRTKVGAGRCRVSPMPCPRIRPGGTARVRTGRVRRRLCGFFRFADFSACISCLAFDTIRLVFGAIAKRLGRGLQILLDRFDSDSRLHFAPWVSRGAFFLGRRAGVCGVTPVALRISACIGRRALLFY